MASTYSNNLRLELMATGANAATWGTNTNDNLKTIDAFVNGYLSKSVAGSSNVSISLSSPEGQLTDDAANKVIELTGTLTGNIYVFLPETESNYLIYNNTSGSYTVTMAVQTHEANGEAVITQSAWHWVYCEGSATYAVREAELGTNASTISTGTLADARLSSNVALTTGDTFTGNLTFNDNVKATFGTGNDLEIYHDGSNSYIINDTNSLYLRTNANDSDVIIQSDDGAGGLATYIQADGSIGEVRLYYYGAEKLNTSSTGITVTGDVVATGSLTSVNLNFTGNLDGGDNDKILLGASDDLQIYHDGSNSIILDNGTGNLRLQSTNSIEIGDEAMNETFATFNDDSDVQLYYNNSVKMQTTSGGILVTGGIDMTATQGDVGTYMFGAAVREAGGSDVVFNTGGTVSGSVLKPVTLPASYNNSNNAWGTLNSVTTGNYQSGTWRCMGAGTSTGTSNSSDAYRSTLWFRIS